MLMVASRHHLTLSLQSLVQERFQLVLRLTLTDEVVWHTQPAQLPLQFLRTQVAVFAVERSQASAAARRQPQSLSRKASDHAAVDAGCASSDWGLTEGLTSPAIVIDRRSTLGPLGHRVLSLFCVCLIGVGEFRP